MAALHAGPNVLLTLRKKKHGI